jgi:hypothetical protein
MALVMLAPLETDRETDESALRANLCFSTTRAAPARETFPPIEKLMKSNQVERRGRYRTEAEQSEIECLVYLTHVETSMLMNFASFSLGADTIRLRPSSTGEPETFIVQLFRVRS